MPLAKGENVGFHLDKELSMEAQVNSVVLFSFHQIRCLKNTFLLFLQNLEED